MKWRIPLPLGVSERQAALLTGLQLYYRLTGLVLLMVVSRRLAQDEIGSFFFAVAFAESLTPLASFNLSPLLTRRVASAPEAAGIHLAAVHAFRLASTPVYLLVAPLAIVFGGGLSWGVAVPVAVFVLLENLFHNAVAVFLARGKVIYEVVIGAAVQTVFLAVFLAGMYLAPGLEVLVGASLFRGFALTAFGLLVIHRRICPLRLRWDSGLIRAGLPFVSLLSMRLLRAHAETLLLGLMAAAESVAVYSLGLRVVEAAQFVPTSFAATLYPRLAASQWSDENRATFRRTGMVLGGLSLSAMGVALAAAGPLCGVMFGKLGDDVAPLLRVLAVQFPLSFGITCAASALVALGHERRVLMAMAVSLGVGVAGTLWLVPHFGPFGAAAARIVSSAIEVSLLAWWLTRLLRAPV